MRIRYALQLVAGAAVLAAGFYGAEASDRRLVGAKIGIKRLSSGKERLSFQSKDPAFWFPPIGSALDPSLGGMRIELFGNGVSASFDVPAGVGQPGWAVKDAGYDSYRFNNSSAPNALSVIRIAFLRESKVLRVKGTSAGLPLLGGQGPVAIRITTGDFRNCALFSGASIVTDLPGKFIGKNSAGSVGETCAAQSLGMATCGNGVTEVEETCDGSDDIACPGLCNTSCACPPPVCGDGIVNGSEACDGTADAACPGNCQPNCTCLGVCGDGIVNAPDEDCDGADGGTIGCDGSFGVGCTAGCSCCSIAGLFCADFGCCSAGQSCIPGPHFSGTCVGP